MSDGSLLGFPRHIIFKEYQVMRSSIAMFSPDSGGGSSPSLIKPSPTAIGVPKAPTTVQVSAKDGVVPEPPPAKIVSFDQKSTRKHEDKWCRTPNVTGTGAIHVKSFHCKMSDDSLVYLDQQVNEWLDAHPQYEVKLVTSSVGEFQGKMGREVHLVLQVWV
jgi:hypothetical protein